MKFVIWHAEESLGRDAMSLKILGAMKFIDMKRWGVFSTKTF